MQALKDWYLLGVALIRAASDDYVILQISIQVIEDRH